VISLRQAAFFASGKADLNPDTYLIVDKLAGLINSLPNHVNLEGHTDAVPIRTRGSRATGPVGGAQHRDAGSTGGAGARRPVPVSIAGYADTVPVASNDDEKGGGTTAGWTS